MLFMFFFFTGLSLSACIMFNTCSIGHNMVLTTCYKKALLVPPYKVCIQNYISVYKEKCEYFLNRPFYTPVTTEQE